MSRGLGRVRRRTYTRLMRRAVDSIVERRIKAAREAGYFDDLPLTGKPIPDIDEHRPAGWWAERMIKSERSKLKELRLEDAVKAAMPALWRLPSEARVVARIAALNREITEHNRLTALDPMPLLDAAKIVAQWRRFRRDG